jgi:dimethylargininase
VPVDISEYIKLEGCVTCLSVRLRDVPSADGSEHH